VLEQPIRAKREISGAKYDLYSSSVSAAKGEIVSGEKLSRGGYSENV
jgi:hypothetical protein